MKPKSASITAAEELANKIIDYLRTHPDSTQAQMQIDLGFVYTEWQDATKFMTASVVKQSGVRMGAHTYSLVEGMG